MRLNKSKKMLIKVFNLLQKVRQLLINRKFKIIYRGRISKENSPAFSRLWMNKTELKELSKDLEKEVNAIVGKKNHLVEGYA